MPISSQITLTTNAIGSHELTENDLTNSYPFQQIKGREREEKVLRHWLLGNQSGNRADPAGGAALVTGFRGVGKTTLVNKVLFDVGLVGLYGATIFNSPDCDWGDFKKDDLRERITTLRDGFQPTLFIPVRIDIANPIEPQVLMRRILRRTYFTLVQYAIGDFCPDIMRRARLAYVRTLGQVSFEATEKLKSTFGMSIENLSKLTVTAGQEIEFAETFKLAAAEISIEEIEDELVSLSNSLTGTRIGRAEGIFKSTVKYVAEDWRQTAERWGKFFSGNRGFQVHLVYVFDELDKLILKTEQTKSEPTGQILLNLTNNEPNPTDPHLIQRIEANRIAISGTIAQTSKPVSSGKLFSAALIVEQLKTMFSTRGMSAVVTGGYDIEQERIREIASLDPMIASIFNRFVYVPQIGFEPAKTLLSPHKAVGLDEEKTAKWLSLVSQGRYKRLIQAKAVLAEGNETELPMYRERGTLGAVAGDWGTTNITQIQPPENVTQLISNSNTVEDLVGVAVSTLQDSRYQNRFGIDFLRAFLAGATIELIGKPPDTIEETTTRLKDFGARLLPDAILDSILKRIVQLLTPPPPPTPPNP